MPKMKLTEVFIQSMRGEKLAEKMGERKLIEYWDEVEKGLVLRVSDKGTKTFYLVYNRRDDGRKRRLKLARWSPRPSGADPKKVPGFTLADAREEARAKKVERDQGVDPQEERKAAWEQAKVARTKTVASLASDFLESQRVQGVKSVYEQERQLDKDILPVLGETPAGEVTIQDIAKVLARIKARGKRRELAQGGLFQANRTRTLMVSMFNFALADPDWREVVQYNPARRVPRPLKKEPSRDRVLSDGELARLWEASFELDDVIGAAYRLRILTGQRWTPIRQMEWSEISEDSVTVEGVWLLDRLRVAGARLEKLNGMAELEFHHWAIPGKKMKKGNPHSIPLVGSAYEIVRSMPQTDRWVFPSPRRAGQPIGEVGKAFARWRELSEVEDFQGRGDLRRTLMTRISKRGCPWEAKQAILGHKPTGVTKVYDRYDLMAEKLLWLTVWDQHIRQLTSEQAKVVEING